MRILIVHNKYRTRGGEDAVVEQEAAALRKHGHEIRVYLRSNNEIKGIVAGLKLLFSSVWSCHSSREIGKMLLDFKPDIMHVHNTWMTISPSCYWIAKKYGIPVVQTLHNYRLFCPVATFFRNGHICEECVGRFFPWPGVLHRCYRKSLMSSLLVAWVVTTHKMFKTWQDKVDVYIALTDFCKKKFIACGMESSKLTIKPNFVSPDPGNHSRCDGYALFAGRLSAEKGIPCLLKTLSEVKAIPVKIVGAGPLSEDVRKRVQAMNTKEVEFLGEKSREEVIALIKQSRFLIFPSEWYECFPMIILEAFACGKAVVAARVGAMQDIVEEGITGRLFELGEHRDLAEKIKWMFENVEACESMGRRARDEFEKKYSEAKNIATLEYIYESAIKVFLMEKA